MMQELLSQEAFTTWLEAKEPCEIVGRACDDEQCPIACYLRELDVTVCSITAIRLIAYYGDNSHDECEEIVPEWAQDFIYDIDNNYGDITAMDALNALYYIREKYAKQTHKTNW